MFHYPLPEQDFSPLVNEVSKSESMTSKGEIHQTICAWRDGKAEKYP